VGGAAAPAPAPPLTTLVAGPCDAHALIDSGHGRKLERFGPHALIRPEPQAMWAPARADWRAEGEFTGGSDEEGGGRWTLAPSLPARWQGQWGPVRFLMHPTPFRHLAFFPDMAPHWAWAGARTRAGDEALNLFAYTGVMSLVLAAQGARVTHLDASRKAVAAARDNAALSGLDGAPIRWIVDDAARFVARELRRGRRYHGIVLDPPKFGRGPAGETWRLEEGLGPLVADCARLLAPDARFLILTCYAIRLSALALAALLAEALKGRGGRIEAGEMAVREEARGLLLPTAIFARWEAG
jgi:23S rRNA (cytosine1962-C5)-methyltransferase